MRLKDVKRGTYILPDQKWMEIEGVGKEDGNGRLVAVYYIYGDVDKKGYIKHRACLVSELVKQKIRPFKDSDYPGGSAAVYYGKGNP